MVILDESGCQINLTPLYGYAKRGQRLIGRIPRNRGRNLTLLAALTLEGVKNEMVMIYEGGTDKNVFETWVEQLLVPNLVAGQTVILDNLGAHRTKRVSQLIQAAKCEVLFLPAYSPDLSPIELMFSKLKHYLRRVGERTRTKLEEAIGQGLLTVSREDARGWFKHCGFPLTAQ